MPKTSSNPKHQHLFAKLLSENKWKAKTIYRGQQFNTLLLKLVLKSKALRTLLMKNLLTQLIILRYKAISKKAQ